MTILFAIVDAYKASIAIRIMSDTRDEENDRNKDKRCLARHPSVRRLVKAILKPSSYGVPL